jgi:predicted RNase H-like HicB family nuclease
MFQYSISLSWSDEDQGYIATIPELPNLSAFGETPEQAVKEAQIAADLIVEIMTEDGEAPPPPKKLIQYSGQTRLRLPKTLHRDLVREAEAEGVSLNTLIVTKMAEYLGRKGRDPETIEAAPQPIGGWKSTSLHQCSFAQSGTKLGHLQLVWSDPRTEVTYTTSNALVSLHGSKEEDVNRAEYH